MTNGEQRAPGIVDSFRRLGDTVLGALQNRVELLSVELAEEKRWLVGTLAWIVAAIFFSGLALLTITATIVAFCPARARPFVLLVFAALYAIAAFISVSKAKAHTAHREMPLASSISELKKDLASLRSQD